MNYRPSKSFLYLMVTLCPLVTALMFGLLPELPNMEVRSSPGEITFSSGNPPSPKVRTVSAAGTKTIHPSEWFEEGYENLMKWEHNPWKRQRNAFGSHFTKLLESKDPRDQAKLRELGRLAEVWHQKLLLRFPELAVTMKTIPDEQNGLLKWLDLSDRITADPKSGPNHTFPKELNNYIHWQGAWNPDAAKAWLTRNQSLVDEIHAIGLLPRRSVNGIPIDRWGFFDYGFAKNYGEILTLEARVAAERGDVAAALESVRAARGLADHFSEIEAATLHTGLVKKYLQNNLENHVLSDIIPALPVDQVDTAVWENAVNPTVSSPAEFARLMKGEWGAINRQDLLPFLLDAEDPDSPPDGGEVLDYFALFFLETVRSHESASLTDLPTLQLPPNADTSHLSWASRQLADNLLTASWDFYRKDWDRTQSVSALTRAAFAIMKGQPIPQDPVYGVDYLWDEKSRQLSLPDTEAFKKMGIKPITVPKR